MKVNLKKIGAIVAGATILASSVSFAGLMFGSTQLVDDNGVPMAKVVVGEKAAASDGVAAGLIASKIASAAFKTSTLTAQVSGTATCDASGAEGTCTVSDESVTLEVTVPGSVVAGTYTLNNLIGDYINRDLTDRDPLGALTGYTLVGSDTIDPANPFKDGQDSGLGPSNEEMFRISGSMFSPFQTTTVTDSSAAKTYQEMQDMWLYGHNKYSDTADDVIGRLNFVAYTLKFKGSGDDLGIPVCTEPTNSTWYATCSATDRADKQTSAHKVQIKFLGEDWIISYMEPPTTTTINNENHLAPGGTVKLAKESISGIINQGESLTVDDLKFQLDDLVAHGGTEAVVISVLDANGNVLYQDRLGLGTSDVAVPGYKTYRFHVYKMAPGYTFGAKWADVAVFADELELQNGKKLNPNNDNNKYWYTYLGWKNRGGSGTDGQVDHLRTIILHADDMSSLSSGGDSNMKVGDYIPIVMDPVKWKLSYNGLSIDSTHRDYLRFTLETSNATISSTVGPLDGTTRVACNVTGPYVKVRSGKSGNVFEYGTSASNNEFWIATGGASCGSLGPFNPGSLFMKESSTSEYWTVTDYTAEMEMRYSTIGDGFTTWASGGMIVWADNSDATSLGNINDEFGGYPGSADFVFGISENAGTGVSLGREGKMFFGLDTGATPSAADFNIDDGTGGFKKDYVMYNYTGPVDSGMAYAEEGFITERGSVFKDISKTSVHFDMANQLAYAQWFLASVATSATPGVTQLTLKEGETGTVSGVTIKAKSIDQTAVCAGGAGGSPVCTPNMSGVSAVIMPNNAATVDAAMPTAFSAYSPLVILDKDAVGVSTVVSVGGDVVNTVTASILSGSTVDWAAEPKMVKEVVVGSKIVVAGQNAEDTMDAANDFISQLQ